MVLKFSVKGKILCVPKNSKCLSVVETNILFDAKGVPLILVALVDVAVVESESHSKQGPPTIKAISLFPKLSKDHKPGGATESVLDAAEPHPVHLDVLVIVAPAK